MERFRRVRFRAIQTPGSMKTSRAVEDQVSPVGPQERSALNLGEVGLPQFLPSGQVPLDGSKEVAIGGRGLDDDRSPFGLRVIHQNIHLIFAEGIHGSGHDQAGDGKLRRFRFGLEAGGVFQDAILHFIQVSMDLGLLVFLLQVPDGSFHQVGDGGFVQRGQFILNGFLHFPGFFENLLHLGA